MIVVKIVEELKIAKSSDSQEDEMDESSIIGINFVSLLLISILIIMYYLTHASESEIEWAPMVICYSI